MEIIKTPDEMRAWSLARRCEGKSIGFVPTMGALHDGHGSLMREAVRRDDVAVLSIFVNPTQFAPTEDLDKYPRTFDADCRMAEAIGVDAVYAPVASTMYPPGYHTYVNVEYLSERLCGASRPVFFRGVATVVTKLFCAVLPHRAYFGQKDAQQCAVVTRMARDLDLGVEIVEMPIVREADGLAMSSRNAYLSASDRERGLCLSRSLFRAQEMLEKGERNAQTLVDAVRQGMADVDIDYVELVDGETFHPVERVAGVVVLAVAARVGTTGVGTTRLIDNIKFRASERD